MRSSMRRDLTAALKARDAVAIGALRTALAAIANAEAVPVGDRAVPTTLPSEHIAGSVRPGAAEIDRRQLTAAELRTIVENEVHECLVAATTNEGLGRDGLADRLRAQAAYLRRYLSSTC